jgi:ubiquinone biosynthesis protein
MGLLRVVRVLAKHGVLGALRGESHLPTPVQLREALEELGVVYLKFGQVLALRRDLLPPEYIAELERLHDNIPPVGFDVVREIVERELGRPLLDTFASFNEEPMAAATIAQVHLGTLHDGRQVIIKVRRPDVETRAEADIPTLLYVAAWAERLQPSLRTLDLVGMVREFRESLAREMDLSLEARTMGRFRAAVADTPQLWIPEPVMDLTTRGVLVEEFSHGERVDIYATAHPGEKAGLARRIALLAMHQVFVAGFFHADPHPGNLFVLSDGRLCLHDFGMIGELDDKLRDTLGDMLAATVRGDAGAVAESYVDMGLAAEGVDVAALAHDLAPIVRQIHDRPLEEVSIGETLEVVLKVGARHNLRNPGSILLLTRGFLITEALVRRLDPDLNVMGLLAEELPRISAARFTRARVAEEGIRLLREIARLIAAGPGDVRRSLSRIASGDLGRVHMPDLEAAAVRVTRDVERLTGGVTSAALLISGSLLGTTSGWHRIIGDTLLAVGIISTVTVGVGALRRRRGPDT